MSDRQAAAQTYHAQGFHPIPTRDGGKESALRTGQRKRYETRQPTVREIRRFWPSGSRNNVALLLGPQCHLLVLNINMKHGHDGLATLKNHGVTVPPTPIILTPHDGFAYLFRPPDREQYPFPFKTHIAVRDWSGIELRGEGGYQLVPPSNVKALARMDGRVDPAGAYRLAEPWTIERILADLADVPFWLLELWTACDRSVTSSPPCTPARVVTRVVESFDSTTLVTAYSTTVVTQAAPLYTGVLGVDGIEALRQDRVVEERSATFMRLRVGGANFACPLPGHEEEHSSVSLVWNKKGELVMRDWHRRHGKEFWALPEVYAALITRKILLDDHGFARSLKAPSMLTWRLRLWVDMGLVAPYPIVLPPLPNGVPWYVGKVYAGVRLLFGCKWHYRPEAPTQLVWGFIGGWSGVGTSYAGKAIRLLVAREILIEAGCEKGQKVYLPGKGP